MNKVDKEKIVSYILNLFRSLTENFGYIYQYKENISEVFEESFTIEFRNDSIKRCIFVNYTRIRDSDQAIHTLSVSAVKLPYLSTSDFFSLDLFLENKMKKFQSSFEGSFDLLKAENLLEEAYSFVEKYLMQMIAGKVWFEGYYPRKD